MENINQVLVLRVSFHSMFLIIMKAKNQTYLMFDILQLNDNNKNLYFDYATKKHTKITSQLEQKRKEFE